MKSTSSWPSRQTSRYSGFVVRTTVVVRVRAGLRDHRRDDVRLVARRAGDQEVGLRDARRREHAPAGAVPLDRGDVVALRERREALLVEVDHGQLVLVVERLDDRRSDLAGADDEDLHRGEVTAPRSSDPVAIVRAREVAARTRLRRRPRRRVRGRRLDAAGRSRAASRRARSRAASRSRSSSPARRASRAGSTSSSRAAGSTCCRTAGGGLAPLLDIRGIVTAGGEQGLLGLAFHPSYPKVRKLYVQYTARNGSTKVVEYRTNGNRATRAAAALLERRPVRQPQRRHARLRPERPALLHDGRRRRRRRPREPRAEHALALRQAALDQRRHEGAQDRGARPPQRLALLVRPRERRPLHRRRRPGRRSRRSTTCRPRAPGSRTTAGTSTRAARRSRTSRSAPASSCSRSRSTATATAARSRAATSTAARTPRCAAATSTATTAAATSGASSSSGGKATGLRRERFKIESVTSFGQDNAGELYAVSHGGTIYRLTP